MIYYTKDGQPTFVPQTDEDRFNIWVEKISDWRVVTVNKAVKNKFGRLVYIEVEKVVGSGTAEPTAAELARVYAKPCRYKRAARASRA
jgi:hypothetical protein